MSSQIWGYVTGFAGHIPPNLRFFTPDPKEPKKPVYIGTLCGEALGSSLDQGAA
jgi:hypothetical protein